ncbi:carbohydrate-binding protein [Abyssalbus ytuae]|uniref:Carbohydrate-binding protein n=1 Tax=Abyssalbus ytuae TaxID=2926907 RepID=A0A9E6ZM73_9FLAO|nr:carbohydrate-binding protein [Abyssalbus ytuae]UOB18377.1 carbohydrate-binding protein [Abyssalbus ytuae]
MIYKKNIYNYLVTLFIVVTPVLCYSQTIMFDDFTYSGINDSEFSTFNKWNVISGISGPPEGGQYSQNNVSFVNDPDSSGNRLVTLSTTVNGQTKATTHSRIETSGFEYFEGTYSARVYFSDLPYTYKDANIQTFYTIVSSSLGTDGSRYSELDFEYMAADKWGISEDNKVLYLTAWNRYIADPWQAWKRYFSYEQSFEGWHVFTVSCTDGVNVKFWIDNEYMGAMSTTDNDGTPVYPRSPMQVAFANWIWNNVTGNSTTNRTTTMKVDWVLFYKDQEVTPQQVQELVGNYRLQGLQRRNLAGNTYYTSPDSNQLPVINITSPLQGSVFEEPATISITAGASDADGSITKVEFYNGSSLIGTDYISPYTIQWQNVNAGSYAITATATDNQDASTTSAIINITVQAGNPDEANIALGKPVVVSSSETNTLTGSLAVDGDDTTRWSSIYSDSEWIYVDLQDTYNINRIILKWEAAYGEAYEIQVSDNASNWETIWSTSNENGEIDDITGLNGTGRYIRMQGVRRGEEWGYSLWEFEVYGSLNDDNPDTSSILIEAEDYSVMEDIATEPCSEGGENVGYINNGSWIVWDINIPSTATYTVEYRVASPNDDGIIQLEKAGGSPVYGSVSVPNTGGWQNWTTISHNVSLTAGEQQIAIYAPVGGWNINWLRISTATNTTLSARSVGTEIMMKDQQLYLDDSVMVYPSPANHFINIRGIKENTSYIIIDLNGRVVSEGNLIQTDTEISVDISSLTNGIYMFKALNSDKTIRFIKN